MKKSTAFTLIELLIAVAMVSMLSITVFYFAFSSIRLMSRAVDLSGSGQTARFIAGRISSDVMQSGGAITGSNSGKLILGGVTYEFVDNKLKREEGNDAYFMTVDGEISNLKFSYPSSKLVGVEITPKTGGIYFINAFARN
jgi:prepilin-type N-terminal cleavage/methylation domain-containing protein